MPVFPHLERVLWFLSILLSLALIVRILLSRLETFYASFLAFLLVSVAQSATVLLAPSAEIYGWMYVISQPLIWVLFILVVLELYSRVLEKHRGVATVAQWTVLGALPISIGVSILTLIPELRASPGRYPILFYYSVIERGLMSSLVIFLLLIAGFLLWFPVPLSRNAVLHAVVYAVYFLSATMTLFVGNLQGDELKSSVSTVLIGVTDVCLLVWIAFLNGRGEERLIVLRRHLPVADESRLLQQLESINSALIRARK